jgi:hypothetical protein
MNRCELDRLEQQWEDQKFRDYERSADNRSDNEPIYHDDFDHEEAL